MRVITGNLFDRELLKTADGLVITTNSVIRADGLATMGAGTAKVAAQMYPQLPKKLAQLLKLNGNITQVMDFIWRLNKKSLAVIAFPTKHHWKNPSDIALIERSAEQLEVIANEHGLENIVAPPFGCGNGQLSWGNVAPVIAKYFGADDRLTVVFKK